MNLIILRFLAVVITPIAWLPWGIELVVRRFHPDWEFNPFTSVPYFISLAVLVAIMILWMPIWVSFIGAYFLSAMELLALSVCLYIAIGHPSPIYFWFKRAARRSFRSKTRDVLLTPITLYMGALSYGFTIYYFALMYNLLYRVWPDNFTGVSDSSVLASHWDFIYFSFVTITTLGSNKVQAALPLSQFLSILHVTLGIIFIIFLFGAFVSYHIGNLSQGVESAEGNQLPEEKV